VAEAEDRSLGAGGSPTPTPSGSFLGVACDCMMISPLPLALLLHDVCIFPLLTKAFLSLISISELKEFEDEFLGPGETGGTPRLANPMTAAKIDRTPPCSTDAEEAGALAEDGDGMAIFLVVESII